MSCSPCRFLSWVSRARGGACSDRRRRALAWVLSYGQQSSLGKGINFSALLEESPNLKYYSREVTSSYFSFLPFLKWRHKIEMQMTNINNSIIAVQQFC